jgi:hypothetical protein
VIEVDPITNLVGKEVNGHQIDVEMLIELLNNNDNEEDANNCEDNELVCEDNEEEICIHEEYNEGDTYYAG